MLVYEFYIRDTIVCQYHVDMVVYLSKPPAIPHTLGDLKKNLGDTPSSPARGNSLWTSRHVMLNKGETPSIPTGGKPQLLSAAEDIIFLSEEVHLKIVCVAAFHESIIAQIIIYNAE